MGDRFSDRLAEEVPGWIQEGIVTDEQAQRLLDRYHADASHPVDDEEEGWASHLLYGTAGALLGAAALAFILVGLDPAEARWPLLLSGGALLGVGVALDLVLPVRRLLAQASMAASLIPMAASVMDQGFELGMWATMAVAAGLIVWQHRSRFVPAFSVVAYAVASGAGTFELVSDGAQAAWLWFAMIAALGVGTVLVDRLLRDEDGVTPVALAVGALAISLLPVFLQGVDIQDSENVELALGGVMALVMTAGLGLKHRGVVVGAAVVLTIDAVVFAFDVGGAFLGTGVLLALAAVMVWQAEMLKGYLAEAV